ncbi:protein JASON-like isoform X2 [Wolffia australiana]
MQHSTLSSSISTKWVDRLQGATRRSDRMGSCFTRPRFKGKQKSSPVSSAETTPSRTGDRLIFRSHIVTLFPHNQKEGKELEQEAMFLKACGALLETPVEFICPSKNAKLQTQSQDVTPNPNLSALDSSCKQLQWDHHTVEVPEDLPDIDLPIRTASPTKTRSVRFEEIEEKVKSFESDSVSDSIQTPRRREQSSVFSPAPTPLKFTEEMETPGTVYPAKLENQRLGSTAQIRSQFLYPIQKSICSETEKVAAEETHLPEDLVQVLNSKHSPELDLQSNDCSSDGIENFKCSDEEGCNFPSPEQWQGKGIPNSTRKYKEDQMVRYHSTPFEERIRKALYDEKVHLQRPKRPISEEQPRPNVMRV